MVDDELVKTIKEIQRKIDYDEEQTYSKVVIREYRNPGNFGVLEHPDAVGVTKGSCGDSMKITLKVENGIIKDARFWTDGCGATLACGNKLTKMIKSKTPTDAAKISQQDLMTSLEGLPKKHIHCATLSVITLLETINDYRKRNKKKE